MDSEISLKYKNFPPNLAKIFEEIDRRLKKLEELTEELDERLMCVEGEVSELKEQIDDCASYYDLEALEVSLRDEMNREDIDWFKF